MRTALAVVIVSILVIGIVIAASDVPSLEQVWKFVQKLDKRVDALDKIVLGGKGKPSLVERVAALEKEVAELKENVSDLKIDVEILQLQLTSINALPIETARRAHTEFGDLAIVEHSGLTIGDYLAGDVIGEIIIVSDERVGEFESLFTDRFYECNIVGHQSPFVNDRSPNSTGITRNYTHMKNISVVSQHQNWTAVRSGNKSCVPAVSGSAIEFWNRTLPSFTRNMSSLFNITDRLHRMMGTTAENGTTLRGFIVGITTWINRTSYAKNMTVKIRGAGVSNGSSVISGVNVSGTEGTGDAFNPVNAQMIIEEFITKNEFVIIIIENPFAGGFHAIAIHSMSNVPNERGNYDVAVMDPESGEIIETEIEPDGSICTEYDEQGNCKTAADIQQIRSISMIGS